MFSTLKNCLAGPPELGFLLASPSTSTFIIIGIVWQVQELKILDDGISGLRAEDVFQF